MNRREKALHSMTESRFKTGQISGAEAAATHYRIYTRFESRALHDGYWLQLCNILSDVRHCRAAAKVTPMSTKTAALTQDRLGHWRVDVGGDVLMTGFGTHEAARYYATMKGLL